MATIKSKLSRLESRLQNLIEAGIERIIPSLQAEEELRAHLFEALETGIRCDPDGTRVAPDLYKIIVNPDQVSLLTENHPLLDKLVEYIEQKGKELEASFTVPPTINIFGDVEIGTRQVTVLSQISPLSIEITNVIEAGSDLGGKQNEFSNDQIESIPPDAFLIIDGKVNYPLRRSVLNIGRRIDNNLVIDDPRVSRLHAQLRLIKGKYVLFDLDSAGGTYVNDERIQQYLLHPGDVISLAGVILVFGQDGMKSTDRTQEIQLNNS